MDLIPYFTKLVHFFIYKKHHIGSFLFVNTRNDLCTLHCIALQRQHSSIIPSLRPVGLGINLNLLG